eukprot:9504185-Pyramimonas_sp.AAC.3
MCPSSCAPNISSRCTVLSISVTLNDRNGEYPVVTNASLTARCPVTFSIRTAKGKLSRHELSEVVHESL